MDFSERFPAAVTGHFTVICVVEGPVPDRVMELGENVQGAGSFQQVNHIKWLYPFTGFTVMVAVTLPPEVTLRAVGIDRVKY